MERNNQIIDDYFNGFSQSELANKYNISTTRVRQILGRSKKTKTQFRPTALSVINAKKYALGFNVQKYENEKLIAKIDELQNFIDSRLVRS